MLDGAEELPELDLGFVFDGDAGSVIAEPEHEATSPLEEPSHRNGVDSDGGPGSRNGLHLLAPHCPDIDFLDDSIVAHMQGIVLPHPEPTQSSAVNSRQEILDAGRKVFQLLVLQLPGWFVGSVVGQVAASMGLLVEGEHYVPVPPAFPCDLGEPIGAEPLSRHQRLEVVLDGDARQPGQHSGRDRIGRNPENRPAPVVDSFLEFESHLAGANGGNKEQPGRRVPADLVDQGLSAGKDFRRIPQVGGMEWGRSRKGERPSRQQERCRDWGTRPHISPGEGNACSQSRNRNEGKRISTKGHEERPRATKKRE